MVLKPGIVGRMTSENLMVCKWTIKNNHWQTFIHKVSYVQLLQSIKFGPYQNFLWAIPEDETKNLNNGQALQTALFWPCSEDK